MFKVDDIPALEGLTFFRSNLAMNKAIQNGFDGKFGFFCLVKQPNDKHKHIILFDQRYKPLCVVCHDSNGWHGFASCFVVRGKRRIADFITDDDASRLGIAHWTYSETVISAENIYVKAMRDIQSYYESLSHS